MLSGVLLGHVLGLGRRHVCACRMQLGIAGWRSQDMHGLGRVSGAMAVVVLVDAGAAARRASVAMVDEHQNAPTPSFSIT